MLRSISSTHCRALGRTLADHSDCVRVPAVYALGLYVDVPAAKGVLRPYRNKPPEKLVKDQAFYDGAACR